MKVSSSALLSITLVAILVIPIFMGTTVAITGESDLSSVSYEGTCDNWYSFSTIDTWYSYNGAKIVESYWDIIIEGGKAIFFMKFIELNIEEEEPGTYDNFKVVMIADSVEATLDGYIITGMSYWWKNEVFIGPSETVITISETNLPTQVSIEIPGWLITGSLLP